MGRSGTQLTAHPITHRGIGGTGSPPRTIVWQNRPALRRPPRWRYRFLLRQFWPLDARRIPQALLPGFLPACARLASLVDMQAGTAIHGLDAMVLAVSFALLPTVSLRMPRWHSRCSVAPPRHAMPSGTRLPDRGPASVVRDWVQIATATMLCVSPYFPAAMTIAALGPGGLNSVVSAAMPFIATRRWPLERRPAALIRNRGE